MRKSSEFIGSDEFGNKYYKTGNVRSVQYAFGNDPTSISADWFLWLHSATDDVFTKNSSWQKERAPNKTGTELAYSPCKSQKHYIAWKPNSA